MEIWWSEAVNYLQECPKCICRFATMRALTKMEEVAFKSPERRVLRTLKGKRRVLGSPETHCLSVFEPTLRQCLDCSQSGAELQRLGRLKRWQSTLGTRFTSFASHRWDAACSLRVNAEFPSSTIGLGSALRRI